MFFSSSRLFSIGQFAKLHEINKKTLMWYDEIGLLKPAVIKENGYRYYTYQQSSILEIILMLRELNVPIRDIRKFLAARSAASLEHLLAENLSEIDRTIAHLTALRNVMASKQQNMAAILTADLTDICVIKKDQPVCLATVDISDSMPLEAEIEKVITEAKKYQLPRLHDASYGAMLSVEKLHRNSFDEYEYLYIQIPDQLRKNGLHIQPKGLYLRAFCRGSWDKLPARYREILAYAKQQNLTLTGFAYEKGINEMVIDTFDDYITQIEIPIKTE